MHFRLESKVEGAVSHDLSKHFPLFQAHYFVVGTPDKGIETLKKQPSYFVITSHLKGKGMQPFPVLDKVQDGKKS